MKYLSPTTHSKSKKFIDLCRGTIEFKNSKLERGCGDTHNAVHSERRNCPQHIEKEAQQDYIKTGDTTPDCLATVPCGPGTPPLIWAYSKQPSASNNTGHQLLRFTIALWSNPAAHQAVYHHPRVTGHSSMTSPCRDMDQADQSLPIWQEVFTLHALLQTRTTSRPLSRLQTVQLTLDINKYCYICAVMQLPIKCNPTVPPYISGLCKTAGQMCLSFIVGTGCTGKSVRIVSHF